ncbi:A/G-specific adenine glycosylase [Chthonobacter rhizosphaerae]|uniref:A/G-specific adenine glycosylase n=1 Tax=Chthonobacter rhizosphaerae TaxID=2735553 RepID=UPI0015EEB7CD|nr:A/G-specific adenine glycosylase [Chthonobacter rhizosphaerae]
MALPAPDSAALLAWYDRHARRLPWRVPPEDRAVGVLPDPYRIWLSEVMLQQTTVAAVKSYFEAFTARWPRLEDLAAASRDDVMKAWAGLGYYSRARNLKACAEAVAALPGGRFPDTEEGLRALPGIGAYTAAAVAAIAFDRRAVVVDGNVERVISRLHAVETPLPAAKPEIRALADALTPDERPGDFAQAVMDLGATICTPKRPACGLCPVQASCAARAMGLQETFPRKAPKKDRPTRFGTVFAAVRPDGALLLRRRGDKGLLGGMTELPGTDWTEAPAADPLAAAPLAAAWTPVSGLVEHTFTHFHLKLSVVRATSDAPAPDGCWWSAPGDIAGEALPTVMKKAVEAAIPGSTRRR